jgi:hypothetical protein
MTATVANRSLTCAATIAGVRPVPAPVPLRRITGTACRWPGRYSVGYGGCYGHDDDAA